MKNNGKKKTIGEYASQDIEHSSQDLEYTSQDLWIKQRFTRHSLLCARIEQSLEG